MNIFLTLFFLIISLARLEATSIFLAKDRFCNTVFGSGSIFQHLQCTYPDKESFMQLANYDVKGFLEEVSPSRDVRVALQIPGEGEFVLEPAAFDPFMSRLSENKGFEDLEGVIKTAESRIFQPRLVISVAAPTKFHPLLLVSLAIFCCCRRGHREQRP